MKKSEWKGKSLVSFFFLSFCQKNGSKSVLFDFFMDWTTQQGKLFQSLIEQGD